VVVFVANLHPLLPGKEGEPNAKFEDESLHFA
jgi:hypothetical protein